VFTSLSKPDQAFLAAAVALFGWYRNGETPVLTK